MAFKDDLPEGFKRYAMIMLPDGKLVNPASCWIVFPSVLDESDLCNEARGSAPLQRTADRYGGTDLAPVMRAGLRAQGVGDQGERL